MEYLNNLSCFCFWRCHLTLKPCLCAIYVVYRPLMIDKIMAILFVYGIWNELKRSTSYLYGHKRCYRLSLHILLSFLFEQVVNVYAFCPVLSLFSSLQTVHFPIAVHFLLFYQASHFNGPFYVQIYLLFCYSILFSLYSFHFISKTMQCERKEIVEF